MTEIAVLAALSQPALIIKSGQISISNGEAKRLFKLPSIEGELSAASLRNPALLSAIEHVQENGGRTACEVQPARNLDEYWLGEVTALGKDPHQSDILVVMTDQKPVRLAQKARADFLANASHELRTPLTSISGFIETMKGPAKDDLGAWPRFIDIMDAQTRHMRELIRDLLSLSRIELSEHLMPSGRVDIGKAAQEGLEALRHIGAARGIGLDLEMPGAKTAPELMMVGDDGEVKQVIANLIGNAVKYAPDHSQITVTVGRSASMLEAQTHAARNWAGAGRMTLLNPPSSAAPGVWLRVRDAGPGVAPENLGRLGERFFRTDDSRGGKIEGTGLGLAIVKHIMARHKGGLAVESVYGDGAAFSVWFVADDGI